MTTASADDLSTNGWRMWPDTNATWTSDKIYLPSDVVLSSLPVNPPTGNWNALTTSKGIPVTLPSSVEQYYWAAFRGGSTDGNYLGVSWWWRTFTAPALQPGQRLIIQFRAARLRSEVYCNQKLCAYNIINEVPFEADVTSAVVQGATTNQLALRITSPGGNLDWGDWGDISWGTNEVPLSRGICGLDAGITLLVRDAVCVSDLAVLNRPNPQEVWVVSAVTNTGAATYNGPVSLSLQDSNAVPVWQGTNTVSVSPGTLAVYTNVVVVPNAVIWDLTNPVLYKAAASIPGNSASDLSVNFGFRWFSPVGIGSNAMLRLNGRRIVMRSAISWGWWAPDGIFPTDAMAQKEVQAAQTLGLNCIQFHRNLGHQNVFDAQDQLGLLRYEEPGNGAAIFGVNPSGATIAPTDLTGNGGAPATFDQKYEEEKILRMVRRDRSHPSLVVYCVQNENQPCLTNPYIFYLFHRIQEIDPSRTVVLHSGIGANNEVLMPAYSTNFFCENGTGYSGWSDQHTVGGPGNYQDSLYVNATNYSHRSTNTNEISMWGEMLGVGMPDDHQAIVTWYQTNGVVNTGYDLLLHQQVLAAYNGFLDKWNFRSSFPTASSLFYEIGKKSYFFWQKIMENARMSDANDYLVISGWESTIAENHSGLVDSHRNFRTDPGIIRQAMNPEVLVVRPKRFVLKPGETANVDVHLINETRRTGVQTLTVTAYNPDGSLLYSQSRSVSVTGGDVYGQVLATNFTFVPMAGGTVRVDGMLQPNGGTGGQLTNEVQIQVIDPLAGAPVMSRIVVCEASNQIAGTLSNVFHLSPLDSSHLSDPLDAIVMGLKSSSTWSYSEWNVTDTITNTSDPGLFQRQYYGKTGTIGTWFGFAPGNITVELDFAETYFSSANSRVFDVAINGTTVLTNFDIYQTAGARDKALVKTFIVNSADGSITISIPKVTTDNAQFAGLRITDASNTVVAAVFSDSSYTDHNGLVWQDLNDTLIPILPVTDPQWQTILNRVNQDGVRLVIWPNTLRETLAIANKFVAANMVRLGSYDGYPGYLPDNTAPWMGSWYFARQHWWLDSLPVNSVLGWQYQIPHGTGDGGGLLMDTLPGYAMDVMIGYARQHDAAVCIGACVIQSGKGIIILPAMPRLRDALTITNGTIITQPVALRLLGNSLRAMPASAALPPPTLSAAPGNRQIVLNWANSFGATSYNLRRATNSGGPYVVIASNYLSTAYTNTGLINGTNYYYVVSGVNALGESMNSPEASAAPRPVTLCALQSQANSKYVTANGVNALIASQSTVGTNEQFAEVDLGGGQAAFQSVASGLYVTVTSASALTASSPTVGNSETFTIASIGSGNISINAGANGSYVSAENAGASPLVANRSVVGSWETFRLITLVAPVPTGLSAVAADKQVQLQWNNSVGASSYKVKRTLTSGTAYVAIITNVSAAYTNAGLANGTTYYYVVSAVDAAGESLNSAEVSATPAPVVLNAVVVSGAAINLAWSNSAVNLYYAPFLMQPMAWTPVTNARYFSNGQWNVSTPLGTNGSGFYRLQY